MARAARANEESVIRREISPRANAPVRTDTAPRARIDADTDDERHRITMAVEA